MIEGQSLGLGHVFLETSPSLEVLDVFLTLDLGCWSFCVDLSET